MQGVQSIIDNRWEQSSKQSIIDKSIIDNRVKSMHERLVSMLRDSSYDIGYTHKICRKLSDYDIISIADYCKRKARRPAAAFISICEKKIG